MFRVQGSGFRVQGSGVRVQGSGSKNGGVDYCIEYRAKYLEPRI